MQLNPTQIRQLPADPEWGPMCYQKELRKGCQVWLQMREQPCGDCAVTGGLYTEIAAGCYQTLSPEQRETVANGWFCHNGGRCEGAWQVLVGEERADAA